MDKITRRGFITGAVGAVGALTLGEAGHSFSRAGTKAGKEAEVSPAEDLMREHGVLRRILLIYEEWVRRLGHDRVDSIETLAEASRLVRSFVEDYHERLEEDYLFPAFRKAGKLVELVDILLDQHKAGRTLTEMSVRMASPESVKSADNRTILASCLGDFIRMYRPHAAREDTILFPRFHEMTAGKKYERLGDMFEKKENELFGKKGFERVVERVASMERKLGIHDLSSFTPSMRAD